MVILTREKLTAALRGLGVAPGDVLMVHASLRALGRVRGGAAEVVRALQECVGEAGTLAAYVDFEPFLDLDDEEEVARMPEFDPLTARAALDHGVLHETMRTWPGARRSGHPDAGVVAIGAKAQWIVEPHPFHYGYGPGTPLARVVEAGGKVLMLGAPLDTITLLHYAEHLAQIPDKRVLRYRRLMPGGEWVDFEEFDTGEPVSERLPENVFELIAEDFLLSGKGAEGRIGKARAVLLEARELVDFAVAWMEREAG
jgi:aminoglycoside 3-N-acetyltransferase